MLLLPRIRPIASGRPILDRANPLTRGLAFLTYPGGTQREDLVNGATGIAQGSASWRGAMASGHAFQTNSTTGDMATWAFPERLLDLKNEITILVHADFTSIASGGSGTTGGPRLITLPFSTSWVAPTSVFSFGKQPSGSGNRPRFTYADSSTTEVVQDGTISANIGTTDPAMMYGVVRRGAALSFVRDHRLITATSVSSANFVFGATKERLSLFNVETSNTLGFRGVCDFVAIWTRALTQAEIAQISANPYVLLRSDPIVFSTATATSATTLKLAATDAGTGTSSGAPKKISRSVAQDPGTSVEVGQAKLKKRAIATSTGTSAQSAVLKVRSRASATSSSTSIDAGNSLAIANLETSSSGTSVDTGALHALSKRNLTAQSTGSSSDAGSLGVSSGLSATDSGNSVETGILRQNTSIEAIDAGTSIDTGALHALSKRNLTAQSTGTSGDTSFPHLKIALNTATPGSSAETGILRQNTSIEAIDAGAGIDTGLARSRQVLVAQGAGTSGDTANLAIATATSLNGASAGTSICAGEASLIAIAGGTSTGASEDNAAIAIRSEIAAVDAGTSGDTASLSHPTSGLSAESAGSSGDTASSQSRKLISGTDAGGGTDIFKPRSQKRLFAIAPGVGTDIGTLDDSPDAPLPPVPSIFSGKILVEAVEAYGVELVSPQEYSLELTAPPPPRCRIDVI